MKLFRHIYGIGLTATSILAIYEIMQIPGVQFGCSWTAGCGIVLGIIIAVKGEFHG